MKKNKRIYDHNASYTTEDCDCKYCLYKGTKKRPCLLDGCCCIEERKASLKREQSAYSGITLRTEGIPCLA